MLWYFSGWPPNELLAHTCLVTCIRVVQCPVGVLTVAHVLSWETHSAEKESKVPVVPSITWALWLPAGLVILPPMIPHAPSSFQTLPEPRPLSHVICLTHHWAHHHAAPVNSQPSGFSINVTSSEKPVLITSAEAVSLHPYYCTGIFYSFADLIAFITIHNYGLRCLFTSLMTTLFPNIGRDEVCLIYFSIPSAKRCTWHIIGM